MDKIKILIVDDERNICFILGTCLENSGYQVDLAATGEHGIEKVRKQAYNLVFLDMKLPGMDGMAVLKEIKQIDPHLNVIMMTAYGTIQSAVEAIKLGAIDFLPKPFSPEQVRDLVDQIIKRQSMDYTVINDYQSLLEIAKGLIVKQDFKQAQECLQKSIAIDPTKPNAFNLLGLLYEIEEQMSQAQKMYRAALSLDPTFTTASENLHRTVKWDYNRQGLTFEADDIKTN